MIVGVDVSSRRIDLAWLEDGKPQRWHQELAKGHLIDRLRSIYIIWPGRYMQATAANTSLHAARSTTSPFFDVTDVAIEYPFGRGNAVAALMATVGVITRQAPPYARVSWPSAGELRQAIGAKNTKADAHHVIRMSIGWMPVLNAWDEHELDALVAAVGWQAILNSQEQE